MNKNSWRIFIGLCATIAIVITFIDWRWTTSFLLGSMCSLLVYKNTEHFVDQTLAARIPIGVAMHSTLNLVIWCSSLILTAVLPQYFNILACAVGLFMIRIAIIIDSFIGRGNI